MTEEIKPDKIKKTQDSLIKFIKKPPLTDKLLKKPPFRFLHDIVTSVMRETGYLEGVFSPEELNSENIKDRDGKIRFLDKLIANIKSVTGTSISAKPSKIIAGLEVNKTLDLLLALAKAVDIKVNGLKSSDNKTSLSKDTKKPSKTTKDDKADPSRKRKDDSKSKEKDAKKKPDPKASKTDKKKSEVNTKPGKNEKLNKPEPNEVPNKTATKPEGSEKQIENIEKPDDLLISNEVSTKEEVPSILNGVVEKTLENGGSPAKRPPLLKERPPSQKERPPSSEVKPLPENRRSSASRRLSSSDIRKQNSDASMSEINIEKQSSVNNDSISTNPDVNSESSQPLVESRKQLPDKVSLEKVVQNSSDSVSTSNLSSDPSDKMINGTISPEINGELSSIETSEKPEKKTRSSALASNRLERTLSRNDSKNENQKQLEKLEENDKHQEPERTVKIKRPQSAKMRPGSIRQRRPPEDKVPGSDDKIGQVVLGQGESSDVMGSAPITAPSAKGRRMLSGRPMSARPGAPKPKDRGQVNAAETPSTSEEVKPIALIEDKKDDEEDAENMVIVEKESFKNDEDIVLDAGGDLNLDESNQGALVAQILETKKELEDTKKGRWDSPYHQRHNVEIDWEARSRTRRDAVTKEVNLLRDSIQTVTRSSNPLGKLFDFLQEDVELMQSELQEWMNTNGQLQKDIQLQNKQTDELLTPLRKQLADLDLLIEHEQESIRRVKSNIFLNSTKLDNLLKISNT